jgi:hypothetical protein
MSILKALLWRAGTICYSGQLSIHDYPILQSDWLVSVSVAYDDVQELVSKKQAFLIGPL